jgi:hypothetical protein
MVCSTFDWSLWIILVFDGLAHPHSWIPYVQIGFNMHLYIIFISFTAVVTCIWISLQTGDSWWVYSDQCTRFIVKLQDRCSHHYCTCLPWPPFLFLVCFISAESSSFTLAGHVVRCPCFRIPSSTLSLCYSWFRVSGGTEMFWKC